MPKVSVILKVGLALIPSFLVAACSTHARRIDCDGPLVPINVPAAVKSPAAQQSDAPR